MAWGEPTPCPELGEGWLRFSKPRGSGERSERADFQWVSPGGQKFRSLKAAQEAAAGGAPGGGAGAASSGKGGKAKKAKTAPKGLKVPYRRPGFAEAQAAAAAAAAARAALARFDTKSSEKSRSTHKQLSSLMGLCYCFY